LLLFIELSPWFEHKMYRAVGQGRGDRAPGALDRI